MFVIEPGLFQASRLGAYPPHGVQVVINVTDDANEFVPGHELVAVVQMPLADHRFPGVEWLDLAVEMISRFRRRNHQVVVHCDNAESRSSFVLLGYSMRERAFSLDEALEDLQAKNPHADPNHRFLEGLAEYEKFLERG
jgi:protein-tyrosine phosphatase